MKKDAVKKHAVRNASRIAAIFLLLIAAVPLPSGAQPGQGAAPAPPRALIVVAHADDESCFSVTTYEITHNLGGTVDQLLITDGGGGYRYSLLAEPYYHASLTDEAVGRAKLPEIRKQEALNAGKILGISNHFFLDEKDLRYTQDVDEVLNQHWHAAAVLAEVTQRLEDGNYGFVLALFPTADTHGAHKAATLTAMNAVEKMQGDRPVVLGCQDRSSKDDKPLDWSGFKSQAHPFSVGPERYTVDRAVKFGPDNALSYQIIANWVIAEHKSQGAFQAAMNAFDQEDFAILETATPSAAAKADDLFHRLAATAAHPSSH